MQREGEFLIQKLEESIFEKTKRIISSRIYPFGKIVLVLDSISKERKDSYVEGFMVYKPVRACNHHKEFYFTTDLELVKRNIPHVFLFFF